jgi:hypothetical protein
MAIPRHDALKEPPEAPRELVSRTIRSEELVEGATITPADHTHDESDITPGGAATSDHGHAVTLDVFILPTQDAHDAILDDWAHNTAGAANEVAFLWHVPAEWTGFNTISVVMIPAAEETIQADIDVSVATAGEAHNADTRQALDETLAIAAGDVDAITEWPLVAVAGLFGGIEPNDVIAIRFQSDTDTMRILGLHINYGAGSAAGGHAKYTDAEAIAAVEGKGTLKLGGGLTRVTVAKTGAYTATSSDHVILCDASGGSFTITLPAASGVSGIIYHIKKTDSSGNAVTVDGNASETIDGATTRIISTQYDSMMIICDGSSWHIT